MSRTLRPRFDYEILKKGGKHIKSNKAKRKKEKQELKKEIPSS